MVENRRLVLILAVVVDEVTEKAELPPTARAKHEATIENLIVVVSKVKKEESDVFETIGGFAFCAVLTQQAIVIREWIIQSSY